jgi:hypothetical protein
MNFAASRTKVFSSAIFLCLVSIGFARQARASGDDGCSTEWRLVHYDYEGCSNMGFLSPSNDTRVNLLLLMADLRAAKPGAAGKTDKPAPDAPLFLWEHLASRLEPQTNEATSTPDDRFVQAVQAEHALKPEERDALLNARKRTRSGCAVDAASGAMTSAEKATMAAAGKAYALYLEGAAEFWCSDYDKAAAIFSSMTNAQPAWVRETAMYMIGRSLIGRAQVGAFDEYGSFKKDWHADAKIVAGAEAALDRYLQQYPRGAYAQSARGLKRRGYWLAHSTGKLEEEYGAILLMSPEERNVSDVELADEIDNKILMPTDMYGPPQESGSLDALLKGSQNPLLLAMLDLLAMRTTEPAHVARDGVGNRPASLSVLEQQKPYFAAQVPLYEYLLAAHAFYVENNPAEVLRMIPDAARQSSFSYVQFSRQMLRGIALEAMKDRNALGFWMQMLPGANSAFERPALELAIAYHEERAGEIRNVFAPSSPVHHPYLREVLLANIADADLLRAQAKNTSAPQRERDIALFTLLYKEATHGYAADFLKDLALVPPKAPADGYYVLDSSPESYFGPEEYRSLPAIPLGIFLKDQTEGHFSCPGLRASEEQLARDAENPTARLCVADFVRLNESAMYPGETPYPADELGGTPSHFPGGDYDRMSTYIAVLADTKSTRDDKAYALYRAVNCYGPSGNSHCGGKDVPKAQRKAWFTTLKHDYAGTWWANALQYYW